jgi:hypothetical protein
MRASARWVVAAGVGQGFGVVVGGYVHCGCFGRCGVGLCA